MVSKIRIPVPSETLQIKAEELMDKYAAGASALSDEIHRLTREIGTLRNNLKNNVIELLKVSSHRTDR
jgi:hypothetical protein